MEGVAKNFLGSKNPIGGVRDFNPCKTTPRATPHIHSNIHTHKKPKMGDGLRNKDKFGENYKL